MESCTTLCVCLATSSSSRSIRWYGPAVSAAALHRLVRDAFELPKLAELTIDILGTIIETDAHVACISDGASLVARELLPSGPFARALFGDLFLGATRRVARKLANEALRVRPDWREPRFQGQLLKFERVLSHLASERTILAWLRAALTLLSQGLSIWILAANTHSSSRLRPWLWGTAGVYFLVAPTTVVLGILRYEDAKRVLLLADDEAGLHFGRLGVGVQAVLMFIICVTAALTFFILGQSDEVFKDFKPTNLFD